MEVLDIEDGRLAFRPKLNSKGEKPVASCIAVLHPKHMKFSTSSYSLSESSRFVRIMFFTIAYVLSRDPLDCG